MKHYWYQPSDPDHKCDCRELTGEDIIAMQTIDADCNDCIHFERGELVTEADGVRLGKSGQYFKGRCLKFNRPTTAHPGQYTGMPCFEHRRAFDIAVATNASCYVTSTKEA